MSSATSALILGIMVVAAAALLGALAWWLFTNYGSGVGPTQRMHCGFRRGDDESWSVGTLSYEEDRLIYSRPGGLFTSTDHHWDRFELDVHIGSPIEGSDVAASLRGIDMVSVPCRYGHETFELAVTWGRYTALRSWVEAVPPGSHSNVA